MKWKGNEMSLKIDSRIALNLSVELVSAYFRKEKGRFQPHLDERTFFVGPREGQVFRNGSMLNNAWIAERPRPDFSVSDIVASAVITSSTTCEVILHYRVIWHKDDGSTLQHPQNTQFSWFIKQNANNSSADSADHDHYKLAVVHISNPEKQDERDLVYSTFGDLGTASIGIRPLEKEQKWVLFAGVGSNLIRYPVGDIIWIESSGHGHQSIVHARDREIQCAWSVSRLYKEYPDAFLRPSVSFLVNPAFIKIVKRFSIELWNGQVLHVPEKKYYDFKRKFLEFMKGN